MGPAPITNIGVTNLRSAAGRMGSSTPGEGGSMASGKSAAFVGYLRGIAGSQVLSGQQLPEDRRTPTPDDLLRLPERPAILGANILVGDQDEHGQDAHVQQILREHIAAGGAVSLCMHPPNLFHGPQNLATAWVGTGHENDGKPDLGDLLRVTASVSKRYRQVLDQAIAYIQTLPADAPVIFRPWHEAGGRHFWWGRDVRDPARSETGVRALWLDTMRIVRAACPNVLAGFSAAMSHFSPIDYGYPPDDEVDAVGASLYSQAGEFAHEQDYPMLVSKGRPVLLFELGGDPQHRGWSAGDIFWATHRYPEVVGFVAGQDRDSLVSIPGGARLLGDARLVNLGDLDFG
ncbi:hypothetical protein D5S17_07070 [Pseudonocardiaceae bacterium YIM PH 21723]|nr:hypothetical protein D5S17_07070 [Pseudonocardiaceae bacterium YIM PH 21723]